jgi:hypothetical protein
MGALGVVGQTKLLKTQALCTPTGLTNSIFVPDNFSNFGSKVANLALRFATFGAIHLS